MKKGIPPMIYPNVSERVRLRETRGYEQGEARKKRKDQQEESRRMLPMPVPMMGMEIADDLPGLCISYPILFRPYPNAEC
jgi:hypothetical protein